MCQSGGPARLGNKSMKKNNVKIKIHQHEKLKSLNLSSIKTKLALCYFTDKQGLCYPTKGTLEDLTGMSKRSIYRAFPSLIEAGLVREEFTNMSGVTVYRVTRRGSFIVLDAADLSALMDISTKAEIIKELDRLQGGYKNSVTPPSDSVTPPADSVTPYTSYREKELTYELELQDMKHMEGKEAVLTATEKKCFCSLWSRWSTRSSSMWRSDNAVEEFTGIYRSVKSLFAGKKNLTTEIRAFDAYLLELEARRLGGYNRPYSDSPFIYAGRGWVKGLKRWLEAPTPATLNERRRQVIQIYGIKVEEPSQQDQIEPVKSKIAVNRDEGAYKDKYGLTIPPRSVEEFTGRIEAREWVKYQLDMIADYPDLQERVDKVRLDAVYWTDEQIKIIQTTPELDHLALWSWLTVTKLSTGNY